MDKDQIDQIVQQGRIMDAYFAHDFQNTVPEDDKEYWVSKNLRNELHFKLRDKDKA